MYFDEQEHEGRPHFHARSMGRWASFTIDPPGRLVGGLSRRATQLVLDWAVAHRDELIANWERGRRHHELVEIAPLP
jgi:hypothetical protein